MKDKKCYVVSFGASGNYSIPFDGSREEFENSDVFHHIKDTVLNYVKEKFPGINTAELTEPEVREASAGDTGYPLLNDENIDRLKHDLVRQVQVMMQDKKMNNNAPCDDSRQ